TTSWPASSSTRTSPSRSSTESSATTTRTVTLRGYRGCDGGRAGRRSERERQMRDDVRGPSGRAHELHAATEAPHPLLDAGEPVPGDGGGAARPVVGDDDVEPRLGALRCPAQLE